MDKIVTTYYKAQRYASNRKGWVDYVGVKFDTEQEAVDYLQMVSDTLTKPSIPSGLTQPVPPMRVVHIEQEVVREFAGIR